MLFAKPKLALQIRNGRRFGMALYLMGFLLVSLCIWNVRHAETMWKSGGPITSTSEPNVHEDSFYLRHVTSIQPIHLVLVLQNVDEVEHALIMLKSLIYHHHLPRSKVGACAITTNLWKPTYRCSKRVYSKPLPLTLHVIVPRVLLKVVKSTIGYWNNTEMEVVIYPFSFMLNSLHVKDNAKSTIQYSMQKLMLPYILSEDVTQVINLSPHLIFNDDVAKLWEEFSKFSYSQVIGAVCEQVENCPTCCPKSGNQFPIYGYNLGLNLMHLKNMRLIEWKKLVHSELNTILNVGEEVGDLYQGVTNNILSKRKRMSFRIGCEWNIHAKQEDGMNVCPVAWSLHDPDVTECDDEQQTNRASVLQLRLDKSMYLHQMKSDNDEKDLAIEISKMNVTQMRSIFLQMNQAFWRLPMGCFFHNTKPNDKLTVTI